MAAGEASFSDRAAEAEEADLGVHDNLVHKTSAEFIFSSPLFSSECPTRREEEAARREEERRPSLADSEGGRKGRPSVRRL